ncbi:hypothetical protein THASP1DRAFT_19951 [Thamnocephalis sphaerospora]|uniref:DUF908 domain-containing protein n=1 Tax=Thamnocephalis sphaerospora TaxID=78915 RepID=A0A4V1IVU9_9FUNG|nr:hypothetical protein THASP1DRAFT_19951 [Thamnocephalis sphaerospora]|eukprot:RKP05319.1 hypothetical protein THASP1DRAFT_19951 [Thamnocephalis sphaerospora]
MKVAKAAPRRLMPPVEAVVGLIARFRDLPESELATELNALAEWPLARSDLFHWVVVLDRFDSILERVVRDYELDKHVQRRSFSTADQRITRGVLWFSRLLVENCTNRNIYNSYEHLNALLNTDDLDVLECNFWLALRQAQRISTQRAYRHNFALNHDRILALAQSWGIKEHGIELVDLCSTQLSVPEELYTIVYHFYRVLTPEDARKAAAASRAAGAEAPDSPSKSRRKSNHFELFHTVRVSTGIGNPARRRQFLVIRLLAVCVAVLMAPESSVQARLFQHEPNLAASLAELIQPEHNIPIHEQVAAISTLEALGRSRARLNEVLAAVNASASHGVLLYVLRKMAHNLCEEQGEDTVRVGHCNMALTLYFGGCSHLLAVFH